MLKAWTLAGDGCDRATAYHMSNKIVRRGEELYVTWLDAAYRNIVARVDPANGAVLGAVAVAQGFDNHCGAAMTLTPDGQLHVVAGSHSGGFVYRSGDAPLDEGRWSLPESPGACATYPSLVSDREGGLHLAHRYSPREAHWGTMYYRRAAGGLWQYGRFLARAPAPLYSYPTNALATGPDGRLHLLVEWYKTYPDNVHPPHSAAVSLLESPDGQRWFHTDGREVRHFPVGLEDTQPALFRAEGNLRPGNLVVLPDGRVCFSVWDENRFAVLLVIRQADRTWRVSDLTVALGERLPGLRCNGQGQVAPLPSGEVVLVVPFNPDGKWGGEGTQLHAFWLQPEDGSLLRHKEISKDDPAEPDWLAAIENPVGGRYSDAPWLLYISGRRGEGCINDARCAVKLVQLR